MTEERIADVSAWRNSISTRRRSGNISIIFLLVLSILHSKQVSDKCGDTAKKKDDPLN